MHIEKLSIKIEVVKKINDWDCLLGDLETSSTYMKWSWGEYKLRSGWSIRRLKISDIKSKKLLACCQLQLKNKYFLKLFFIQGGIHVSKENNLKNTYDYIYQALYSYIKKECNSMWIFLINYQVHNFDNAVISMLKLGFTPVITKKMLTYILLEDKVNHDALSLTANWRLNLKRALKNKDLKIECATTYTERLEAVTILSNMYNDLKNRKNFISAIDLNKARDIIAEDKSLIIAQAKINNEIVAIRISSVCNDHILDFITASNAIASKNYANYLLMWEMIMKMKEAKKRYYDTGGIDPSTNIGSYNFKKGLNGKLVVNGPIWCMASNNILLWLVRLYLLR